MLVVCIAGLVGLSTPHVTKRHVKKKKVEPQQRCKEGLQLDGEGTTTPAATSYKQKIILILHEALSEKWHVVFNQAFHNLHIFLPP